MRVERISDFAARWSVSRGKVYKMIAQGLPTVKMGRSRRVLAEQADAWILAGKANLQTKGRAA